MHGIAGNTPHPAYGETDRFWTLPPRSRRPTLGRVPPFKGRGVETEDYSMMWVRTWSVWAVAAAVVFAWNGVARAQATSTTPGTPGLGQHPFDNVSGGALAARSPGNMVSAGVGRAQAAADFARGGIEIVETSRPTSPRAVFLVDAIEIIFEQLNLTLLYLGDILRQRAGLPPLVPQVTTPTTPDTTDDEATNGVDAGDVNVEDLRNLVGDK